MDYRVLVADLQGLFSELLPAYIGTAHKTVGTKIESKKDGTPVTDLDNHSLSLLRELITKYHPKDFTIGEEDKRGNEQIQEILECQGQRQWTIDGLDGTWHFAKGTNSYGAMVANRLGGAILFAAIFRPIDQRLRGNGFFYAERGKGAWQFCSKCSTYHKLQTAKQEDRFLVMLEGSSKKFFKPPISNLGQAVTTRPSLSASIAATTVASGRASAVVTVENKPWDNWPIMLFVEEAGGIVTDWQGNPVKPENCGSIIAAATKDDHAQVVKLLNQ